MAQFFSPEGQELGELHRDHLVLSRIMAWESGAFLTYFDFSVNRQILIWLNADGSIQHEDSLQMPTVQFAYVQDGTAQLVTEDYNNWLMTNTVAVHSYASDGALLGVDTVLVQQLEADQFTLSPSFYFRGNRLTVLSGTIRGDQSANRYQLQITHFDGVESTNFPPWNPGPLATDINLFPLAVHEGPWETSIVGYGLQGESIQQIRMHAVSAGGVPEDADAVVELPQNSTINGLKLLWANSSVYAAYTINDVTVTQTGGAYVTAFPLSDILSTSPQSAPLPIDLKLSAYPNPFNGSVQIDYALPFSGKAALTIYDITGRMTFRHELENSRSEHGTWVWTPTNAASGIYFVEISAGTNRVSSRLVYLK